MINPHFPGWSWYWYCTRPWTLFYDLWRDAVAFCQRGWRGYADRDCWSIDFYVAQWMPKALDALRQNKIGYPSELEGKFPDPAAMWEYYLTRMMEGFDAHIKLCNIEFSTLEESKALQKSQKEGLALFAKWFGSLWD